MSDPKFKVGDKVRFVADNGDHAKPIPIGQLGVVIGPDYYGRGPVVTDGDAFKYLVNENEIEAAEPESDGTLSLLEAMIRSNQSDGAPFEWTGPTGVHINRYYRDTLWLTNESGNDEEISPTGAMLTARYRMCKSPLEELEERQAKELESAKHVPCHADDAIYELGLRHAAERAELEGRE